MNIRPMTIADYDRVYALWMSCKNMGFNNLDDSREGIDRLLKRNPNTCLVAVEDGEIAGVILAGNDGRRGYLYHVAVGADYRRRGVGTELVQKAMRSLRRAGIRKTALVVYNNNLDGNEFWERMGFTPREDLVYRNKELIS